MFKHTYLMYECFYLKVVLGDNSQHCKFKFGFYCSHYWIIIIKIKYKVNEES